MAAIAERNFAIAFAGLPAKAVVTTFEDTDLLDRAYSLIYAATSWRGLDPATRFERAGRAIDPGGTLAVLWTWPRWCATELRPELDEVYRASGAPLDTMGPMHDAAPDPAAPAREWKRAGAIWTVRRAAGRAHSMVGHV